MQIHTYKTHIYIYIHVHIHLHIYMRKHLLHANLPPLSHILFSPRDFPDTETRTRRRVAVDREVDEFVDLEPGTWADFLTETHKRIRLVPSDVTWGGDSASYRADVQGGGGDGQLGGIESGGYGVSPGGDAMLVTPSESGGAVEGKVDGDEYGRCERRALFVSPSKGGVQWEEEEEEEEGMGGWRKGIMTGGRGREGKGKVGVRWQDEDDDDGDGPGDLNDLAGMSLEIENMSLDDVTPPKMAGSRFVLSSSSPVYMASSMGASPTFPEAQTPLTPKQVL